MSTNREMAPRILLLISFSANTVLWISITEKRNQKSLFDLNQKNNALRMQTLPLTTQQRAILFFAVLCFMVVVGQIYV